jgi:hypothetical protein
MATSWSPPFPQPPTSAPAEIPVPSVAGSDHYLAVGSAQGSGLPPQSKFARNDLGTFSDAPG